MIGSSQPAAFSFLWVGCWGESRMSLELELPSESLALSVVDRTRQKPAWCSSILCAAALHIRRHWAPGAASMEALDNLLNFLVCILLLGEGETMVYIV